MNCGIAKQIYNNDRELFTDKFPNLGEKNKIKFDSLIFISNHTHDVEIVNNTF